MSKVIIKKPFLRSFYIRKGNVSDTFNFGTELTKEVDEKDVERESKALFEQAFKLTYKDIAEKIDLIKSKE